MARKFKYYADGTAEMWDDESCIYSKFDNEGYEVEQRPLTEEELVALNPNNTKLRELTEVVDQLILDQLMGGML